MEKPATLNHNASLIAVKKPVSEKLSEDVARFIADGKQINRVGHGVSAYPDLATPRNMEEYTAQKMARAQEIAEAKANYSRLTVPRGKPAPIANVRFGKLVALYIDPDTLERTTKKWVCKCDCGQSASVRATELINGYRLWCNACAERLRPSMRERSGQKPLKLTGRAKK